jgi:DNA polymerase III subunit gamma/tau
MASQVLYRKWRPKTLAGVVGQQHVTQTLLNALKSGHVSHAYLFCGPRGTGKTSTARNLAKAVNCLTNGKGEPCNTCAMCQAITEDRALDVIEIDAASNRGIDEIRDLREKVNYAPSQARYKVYIIDEVHMLTKEASNALLKTLEEPPAHVIFILATTEQHKVLPTILSRCQHFTFHRVSRADVVAMLSSICQSEGIQIDNPALQLIAKSSTGSLRDAENLLEQLFTCYGAKIQLGQVQALLGITGDARAKEVVKHLINNDISAGMAALNGVNSDGLDLRQFNRELVEYLRALLMVKSGAPETVDVTAEDLTDLKEMSTKTSLPQILKALKLFGQIEIGYDNYSTLPLELALVDCSLPAVEEKAAPAAKAEIKTQPVKPAASRSVPTETRPPAAKPTAAPKVVTEEKVSPVTGVKEQPVTAPTTGKEQVVAAPTVIKEQVAAPNLSSEIERLKFNWKKIIEEAAPDIKKTNAIARLRSGGVRPLAIEADTVVLSFIYPIHRENMEKPENKQIAEKLISGYLGRACRVRCVDETENNHLVRAALKKGAQITSVEEK